MATAATARGSSAGGSIRQLPRQVLRDQVDIVPAHQPLRHSRTAIDDGAAHLLDVRPRVGGQQVGGVGSGVLASADTPWQEAHFCMYW